MNRISRIVAGFSALTIAVVAAPAFAQSQDYSIAKVIKQGTTTQPIAGSGTVLVQVQVNADGTHKVVKILKSDNTATTPRRWRSRRPLPIDPHGTARRR